MLLKILKSHPQVRSYYIPAHLEVKSLEANFQMNLLVRGSSYHVVLLFPPTHRGHGFSATYGGWVAGEAWGDCSFGGAMASGML